MHLRKLLSLIQEMESGCQGSDLEYESICSHVSAVKSRRRSAEG